MIPFSGNMESLDSKGFQIQIPALKKSWITWTGLQGNPDSSFLKKLNHLDWTPRNSRFQFFKKVKSPGLDSKGLQIPPVFKKAKSPGLDSRGVQTPVFSRS